jgi:hypothetical protein
MPRSARTSRFRSPADRPTAQGRTRTATGELIPAPTYATYAGLRTFCVRCPSVKPAICGQAFGDLRRPARAICPAYGECRGKLDEWRRSGLRPRSVKERLVACPFRPWRYRRLLGARDRAWYPGGVPPLEDVRSLVSRSPPTRRRNCQSRVAREVRIVLRDGRGLAHVRSGRSASDLDGTQMEP